MAGKKNRDKGKGKGKESDYYDQHGYPAGPSMQHGQGASGSGYDPQYNDPGLGYSTTGAGLGPVSFTTDLPGVHSTYTTGGAQQPYTTTTAAPEQPYYGTTTGGHEQPYYATTTASHDPYYATTTESHDPYYGATTPEHDPYYANSVPYDRYHAGTPGTSEYEYAADPGYPSRPVTPERLAARTGDTSGVDWEHRAANRLARLAHGQVPNGVHNPATSTGFSRDHRLVIGQNRSNPVVTQDRLNIVGNVLNGRTTIPDGVEELFPSTERAQRRDSEMRGRLRRDLEKTDTAMRGGYDHLQGGQALRENLEHTFLGDRNPVYRDVTVQGGPGTVHAEGAVMADSITLARAGLEGGVEGPQGVNKKSCTPCYGAAEREGRAGDLSGKHAGIYTGWQDPITGKVYQGRTFPVPPRDQAHSDSGSSAPEDYISMRGLEDAELMSLQARQQPEQGNTRQPQQRAGGSRRNAPQDTEQPRQRHDQPRHHGSHRGGGSSGPQYDDQSRKQGRRGPTR